MNSFLNDKDVSTVILVSYELPKNIIEKFFVDLITSLCFLKFMFPKKLGKFSSLNDTALLWCIKSILGFRSYEMIRISCRQQILSQLLLIQSY